MTNMKERELLVDFKKAKEQKEALAEQLKEANKEFEQAEMKLIEHLTEAGAEATAKYEGLGYVKMAKPRVYANVKEESKDELFKHLKKDGREDIIKTAVAPAALSSYVGELIENGKAIPEFIGYYLKTSLRAY